MTITNRVSLKSVEFGVTSIEDVVDAPTIGTATAGAEQATVPFTAAATGGAATTFTATSTPGSITGSSATSPITVTGLTGGTSYTFKVHGANASGTWSAVQSAASNSVTPTVATSFESIATVTVGSGGSSTITFSSIPGTYAHLQIRAIHRGSNASAAVDSKLNFNSDTASGSYVYYHQLLGDGASASADASTGVSTYTLFSYGPAASASASIFGVSVVDILDYKDTNKYKTVRNLHGFDVNGAGGYVFLRSGLWMKTDAITSIDISPTSGNFAQYSSFALYGIKGA